MTRFSVRSVLFVLLALAAASAVVAQDPVPRLQDLVGAKGGMAENQLIDRGFEHVRTDKSSGSVYAYWREIRTNRCVTIHVDQGRYQSIVFAPHADCAGGGGGGGDHMAPPQDGKHEFQTVCGKMEGRRAQRHQCKAVEHRENGKLTRTVVYFPGQTMALNWNAGGKLAVKVDGVGEPNVRHSTSEGETNFDYKGETYYYISDHKMAKMEVNNL